MWRSQEVGNLEAWNSWVSEGSLNTFWSCQSYLFILLLIAEEKQEKISKNSGSPLR